MRQKGALLPYLFIICHAGAVKLHPNPALNHLFLGSVFQDNLYIPKVKCLYVDVHNPFIIVLDLSSCLKRIKKFCSKSAWPSEPLLLFIKLKFFLPEEISDCVVNFLHVQNAFVLDVNNGSRGLCIVNKIIRIHENFSDFNNI